MLLEWGADATLQVKFSHSTPCFPQMTHFPICHTPQYVTPPHMPHFPHMSHVPFFVYITRISILQLDKPGSHGEERGRVGRKAGACGSG